MVSEEEVGALIAAMLFGGLGVLAMLQCPAPPPDYLAAAATPVEEAPAPVEEAEVTLREGRWVTLTYKGVSLRRPANLFSVGIEVGDIVPLDWALRAEVQREKRRHKCLESTAAVGVECLESQVNRTCQTWADAVNHCNKYWGPHH